MKWLLTLLVLANAGFYAYSQLVPATARPAALPPELNADRLRLVDASRLVPEPVVAPVQADSSVVASEPVVAVSPMPQASSVCLRWIVPSPEQAGQAMARMTALNVNQRTLQSAEQAKVWVYIPPLVDLDAAKRKAEELRQLGIEDYFIVNNGGRWQNAVSLGVFSTREAAERHLATLRTRGVRSAVVRERDDTLRPATFLLLNVSPGQREQLEQSNRRLRGAQLVETACR